MELLAKVGSICLNLIQINSQNRFSSFFSPIRGFSFVICRPNSETCPHTGKIFTEAFQTINILLELKIFCPTCIALEGKYVFFWYISMCGCVRFGSLRITYSGSSLYQRAPPFPTLTNAAPFPPFTPSKPFPPFQCQWPMHSKLFPCKHSSGKIGRE